MNRRTTQQPFDTLDDALKYLREWIEATDRDADPEFGIDPYGAGWSVWREVNA